MANGEVPWHVLANIWIVAFNQNTLRCSEFLLYLSRLMANMEKTLELAATPTKSHLSRTNKKMIRNKSDLPYGTDIQCLVATVRHQSLPLVSAMSVTSRDTQYWQNVTADCREGQREESEDWHGFYSDKARTKRLRCCRTTCIVFLLEFNRFALKRVNERGNKM